MDFEGKARLETNSIDSYGEAYYRRDYSDGDKQSILEAMREGFGSDKEAWDDLRRRERMAQIMYDI